MLRERAETRIASALPAAPGFRCPSETTETQSARRQIIFLDAAVRVPYMFQTDMETHTPTPAERYTALRGKLCLRLEAEGPRYGIARAVDLLVLQLITYMIYLALSRAERQAEPCPDVAGAEPCHIAAPDAGADRQAAAGRPDAGARPIASATVAAACDTPVIDRATDEACTPDAGGAAATRERPPERSPHAPRPLAAMAWTAPILHDGHRFPAARFAKTGFSGLGRIAPNSLRFSNNPRLPPQVTANFLSPGTAAGGERSYVGAYGIESRGHPGYSDRRRDVAPSLRHRGAAQQEREQ